MKRFKYQAIVKGTPCEVVASNKIEALKKLREWMPSEKFAAKDVYKVK